MSQRRIVDYYAVLNIPPTADLSGIENAYARLSDELARQIPEDETAAVALKRLNEAFMVLSRPEHRREYDKLYFSKEIAEYQAAQNAARRRKTIVSSILVGSLLLIVAAQSLALAYLGREYLATAVDALSGRF
ncbi:MAG: hypothetical protein Kow0010_12090 [Dehalococcoidia bacterium]